MRGRRTITNIIIMALVRGGVGGILPGLAQHVLNSVNIAARRAITPDTITNMAKKLAGTEIPRLVKKIASTIKNKRDKHHSSRASGVYRGRRIQRSTGLCRICCRNKGFHHGQRIQRAKGRRKRAGLSIPPIVNCGYYHNHHHISLPRRKRKRRH